MLLSLDNSLQIDQISTCISAPIENNNSSLENSRIKLSYYGSHIGDPLVVCDDEVILKNSGISLGFGTLFKRLGGTTEILPDKIFIFLQKYIRDNPGLILKRRRYFGLKYLNKTNFITDTYEAELKTLDDHTFEKMRNNANKLDNPLNYYVITNHNNTRLYQVDNKSIMTYKSTTKDKFKKIIDRWKVQYEKQ